MGGKRKILFLIVALIFVVLAFSSYWAYDFFYSPRYLEPVVTVGDKIPRLKVVSYGQETYLAWREREVRRRAVVILDDHLDLNEIDPNGLRLLKKARRKGEIKKLVATQGQSNNEVVVNQGNWLFAAQHDGTVRSIYWIVPDSLWEEVEEQAQKQPTFKKEDELITGEVNGKPLTMCKINDLPHFEEPVLIFVGLDYFLIDPKFLSAEERVEIWNLPPEPGEGEKPVPWIFPKDVFSKLVDKKLETDLVVASLSYENQSVPDWHRGLIDEMVARFRKELER